MFCQYNFWSPDEDTPTPTTVVPPLILSDSPPPLARRFNLEDSNNVMANGERCKFDHSSEYEVTLTEDFVEHCAEGALSIEVYGHLREVLNSSMECADWMSIRMSYSRLGCRR